MLEVLSILEFEFFGEGKSLKIIILIVCLHGMGVGGGVFPFSLEEWNDKMHSYKIILRALMKLHTFIFTCTLLASQFMVYYIPITIERSFTQAYL